MTAAEIRQAFLDFFQSKEHHIVPSAPIVIKNDPTLLFTNAGMNQFKDYFLGNKDAIYPRVADTQKCLRVSGKHNDLEEVGVDTYHHTMFEMLGNWSFGNYFKTEAIAWAWELLTKVYKLDKDRLYVTVFEGDEKDNLPMDVEAYEEWKKWIAEERILMGNKKDNFWEMGDTGPCGPCSEIHVDCRTDAERAAVDGKTLVNADHPQVIEIWNLVFMQFNRKKDGHLEKLPARHVDTGMGFERLVRVIQSKASNYDTDVFTGTIAAVEKITGKKYDFSDNIQAVSFRVIADHVRAIAFSVADGQLPFNTGAGYVIRRILRRAVRYYYSCLDYKTPLLFQLVELIATQFEHVFPELKKQEDFVRRVIREEEEGFLRTLEAGLKRMDNLMAGSETQQTKRINGTEAFELYDTYGFPLDLSRLIASENGLDVDEAGFEAEMKKQKDRSRQATAIDAGDWIPVHEGNHNIFVGYDDLRIDTRVLKYRQITEKKKTLYQIVLAETPFYAESGGQVGDQGTLIIDGKALKVIDTKKENDLIIHFTEALAPDMNLPVTAQVDLERRLNAMYNHTATHLLHAALKQVLGKHVNQKGSLVSPEILRFDVSHFAKITEEELREVSNIVNEKIRENIPVVIREMPKEEAMKTGAMALFGEKYGDVVRVVTIDPQFSIELCGGTHVGHTGMIGLMVITGESAVAAGVRRIEALTGGAAFRYLMTMLDSHKSAASLLKNNDPIKSIEKLMNDKSAMEKKLEALEAKERSRTAKELFEKAESIGNIHFVAANIHCDSADELKKTAYELQSLSENIVAVLTADIQGKANVALYISESLSKEKSWDAGKMIREIVAPVIKGGGGGQKTLATAGGKDVSALNNVMAAIKSFIAEE